MGEKDVVGKVFRYLYPPREEDWEVGRQKKPSRALKNMEFHEGT